MDSLDLETDISYIWLKILYNFTITIHTMNWGKWSTCEIIDYYRETYLKVFTIQNLENNFKTIKTPKKENTKCQNIELYSISKIKAKINSNI